jgi:hypothetical protein
MKLRATIHFSIVVPKFLAPPCGLLPSSSPILNLYAFLVSPPTSLDQRSQIWKNYWFLRCNHRFIPSFLSLFVHHYNHNRYNKKIVLTEILTCSDYKNKTYSFRRFVRCPGTFYASKCFNRAAVELAYQVLFLHAVAILFLLLLYWCLILINLLISINSYHAYCLFQGCRIYEYKAPEVTNRSYILQICNPISAVFDKEPLSSLNLTRPSRNRR